MMLAGRQPAGGRQDRRVLHQHAHAAQTQDLAGFQRALSHLLVVDEHAIGGIHVAHEHPLLVDFDFGVEAGNGVMINPKIVPGGTTQPVDTTFEFDDSTGNP